VTHVPAEVTARFRELEVRYAETARCRAAALQARLAYPGPLGELVYREIIAFAEFGYRFGDGVVPRLIDELLDNRPDPRAPEGRSG
jgi:hypothetical protein